MPRPKLKNDKIALPDSAPGTAITDIDAMTHALANKTYGEKKIKKVISSLSIDEDLLKYVQTTAFNNKMNDMTLTSASAVINDLIRRHKTARDQENSQE